MGEGFQFLDIVLFAMIAAFLILRLRSVLGRRHDHHPPNEPFAGGPKPLAGDDDVITLPKADVQAIEDEPAQPQTPVEAGLADIARASGGFALEEFLAGARGAFEMIVEAFAKGDVKTLRLLLNADILDDFQQSIRAREENGQTLENTLVGIRGVDAIEAYMEGRDAFITLKIVSEQVNVLRDAAGEIVEGDPNKIAEITDIWTFSRDTHARDPNWQLVATRSLA